MLNGRLRVPSLGQEDPLEEEKLTHSSILAWEIPWKEEPGRQGWHLPPPPATIGLQRVGHN